MRITLKGFLEVLSISSLHSLTCEFFESLTIASGICSPLIPHTSDYYKNNPQGWPQDGLEVSNPRSHGLQQCETRVLYHIFRVFLSKTFHLRLLGLQQCTQEPSLRTQDQDFSKYFGNLVSCLANTFCFFYRH